MAMRRFGSDRGQSLVVFLITLPVMILVAGMVIDGGNAFAHKRQIQNAADASALAAVQDLDLVLACTDDACREGYRDDVRDRAQEYSLDNGGTGTLHRCADRDTNGFPNGDPEDFDCYTWPYKGSWAKVEVKLQRSAGGFFTQFLGLAVDFFKPSARAVAALGSTSVPHCSLGDAYLPDCVIPGSPDTHGTLQPGAGAHCDFTGADPPVPEPWDDYLPDCIVPGSPDVTGTVQPGSDPHCVFNPPVSNPDQYLNTVPPCTIPGSTTGGTPAIAFAHCGYPGDPCTTTSSQCTAMHISGSNNHFYGAIVSDGGVQESGGNYGALPDGNALLYYGSQINPAKCLVYKPTWAGPPTAQAPVDWPVPLPILNCSNGTVGTSCPSGTWPTSVNGTPCKKLPSDKYTVNSNTQPASLGGGAWSGLYCATVSITINQSGIGLLNAGWVAPDIGFSSCCGHITGYTGLYAQQGGLLFDAYRGDLNWSGSSNQWTGAVFVPLGNAQVSGGGSQGTCAGQQANSCGFVEGQTLQLSGSGGTWQGLGPAFGSVTNPPVFGTFQPGNGSHCVFDPPVDNPDQYLTSDPPCTIPGDPDNVGTLVPGDDAHCDFTGADPPVPAPWDAYLLMDPPCTIAGSPDTVGTITSDVTPGDASMDE